MGAIHQRPLWLDLYAEALLNAEPGNLVARIDSADAAIQCRFRELRQEGIDAAPERDRLMSAQYSSNCLGKASEHKTTASLTVYGGE